MCVAGSGSNHEAQNTGRSLFRPRVDDGSGVGYVDCGPGHDYDTSREHASTVPPGASKYFVAPENGGFCAITLHDSRTATIDFHLGDSGAPLNYTVASWPNARRS